MGIMKAGLMDTEKKNAKYVFTKVTFSEKNPEMCILNGDGRERSFAHILVPSEAEDDRMRVYSIPDTEKF